jgi:hypothetical protein
MMSRFLLATAVGIGLSGLAGFAAAPAQADPYPWCAEYGGGDDGGSTSCYFMTLQQCRESVSGVGGFCRRNLFYDGQPVRTPEDPPPRRRRAH